jgi:hypothetical protein
MLDTGESLQFVNQKHSAMIMYQEAGLNPGTLSEVVCQSFVLP